MKIIKCELCGSNKLTKIDGEYICDYCHTHYTAEEAKKLIINGPVEITGNIQIDNSLMIDNYKKLAERAFNDKLYSESYDYYQKILELDPDDWEAIYKKGLCSAKDSTLFNPKLEELINSSKNSIKIIKDNNLQINLSELMYNMAYDINSITLSFYNLSKDYYLENWQSFNSSTDYWVRLLLCISAEEYCSDLLSSCNNTEKNRRLYLTILKNTVIYYCELCKKRKYINNGNTGLVWYKYELKSPIIEKYTKTIKRIKIFDSNYVAPPIDKKDKKGCYVATCVYGSYDCPEVWTLRRFRDYYLDNKFFGKLFIKLYYFISPKVVKVLGKSKYFKLINKFILDKFILVLNNKGYKNTIYNDKY